MSANNTYPLRRWNGGDLLQKSARRLFGNVHFYKGESIRGIFTQLLDIGGEKANTCSECLLQTLGRFNCMTYLQQTCSWVTKIQAAWSHFDPTLEWVILTQLYYFRVEYESNPCIIPLRNTTRVSSVWVKSDLMLEHKITQVTTRLQVCSAHGIFTDNLFSVTCWDKRPHSSSWKVLSASSGLVSSVAIAPSLNIKEEPPSMTKHASKHLDRTIILLKKQRRS